MSQFEFRVCANSGHSGNSRIRTFARQRRKLALVISGRGATARHVPIIRLDHLSGVGPNRYALAVTKAPRWGGLRLAWGEALAAQGKTTEAKAQFTAAAAMDLTADERSRLARAQAHG